MHAYIHKDMLTYKKYNFRILHFQKFHISRNSLFVNFQILDVYKAWNSGNIEFRKDRNCAILYNSPFATIFISGQINTGPMDQFFIFMNVKN